MKGEREIRKERTRGGEGVRERRSREEREREGRKREGKRGSEGKRRQEEERAREKTTRYRGLRDVPDLTGRLVYNALR